MLFIALSDASLAADIWEPRGKCFESLILYTHTLFFILRNIIYLAKHIPNTIFLERKVCFCDF